MKFKAGSSRLAESTEPGGPDSRDGSIYLCCEETERAVQVAMATRRPLLLFGPPGSGKSSLASYVARCMSMNYFERVITSRTSAKDLFWRFDALRRLSDANTKRRLRPDVDYVIPGALWWAFNPKSAAKHAGRVQRTRLPVTPHGELRGLDKASVALLDEIDKAEPDMPNDLLVELGSESFHVTDGDLVVQSEGTVQLFITSNDERSLPDAFIRRCVVHTLKVPDPLRLAQIATAHFPEPGHDDLFMRLAERVHELRQEAERARLRGPSTAEYLDAVRACLEFDVRPADNTPLWETIDSIVLRKAPSTAP